MKDFNYPILDHLKNGLAKNYNRRNMPFLVESIGAFPQDEKLRALEVFTAIDVAVLGTLTFPYPQLFVFSDCIIVCTSVEIYEYDGSSLTLKLLGIPECSTWTAVDFKTYIYLTNGAVIVEKSATTGEYSLRSPTNTLPAAMCCCNYSGQVLLGSPITAIVPIYVYPTPISIAISSDGSTELFPYTLNQYYQLGVDPGDDGEVTAGAIKIDESGVLFFEEEI